MHQQEALAQREQVPRQTGLLHEPTGRHFAAQRKRVQPTHLGCVHPILPSLPYPASYRYCTVGWGMWAVGVGNAISNIINAPTINATTEGEGRAQPKQDGVT